MENKKSVFVSLPVTSRKEPNFFEQKKSAMIIAEQKARMLKSQNYIVVTPFTCTDEGDSDEDCSGKCIAAMRKCDCIYLCSGWRHSRGCQLEYDGARIYGKEIIGDEL